MESPSSLPYRTLAGAGALLGGFALVLQLGLSIQLTIANGQGAWAGVWSYLGYFTIWTNVLATLALGAAAGLPGGAFGRLLRRAEVHGALAMSIVIVCAIYNLLLRQLWQPHGWQIVADRILHDVMPPLFLLHWWLAVPKATLRWRGVLAWQVYPAVYFAVAMIRGAFDGWYPYPFLDVGSLGYLRVLLDACAVLLVFVAVGLLLLALGRWQQRRGERRLSLP